MEQPDTPASPQRQGESRHQRSVPETKLTRIRRSFIETVRATARRRTIVCGDRVVDADEGIPQDDVWPV